MAVILPVPESEQRVLENLLRDLKETYPDKVIVRLQQDHKKWYEKVTRLYKNIGYDSRDDFLAAYGFTEVKGKGGRPSEDLNAIAEELIKRYQGDRCVSSVDQLKEENPDLAPKFKSLQNKSKDMFGMTFVKYLKEKGVIDLGEKTSEEIAAEAAEKERLINVKDKADLKDFDLLFQREHLGWKPLSTNAEELISELDNSRDRKRLRSILERLNIDSEEHFRALGVLAIESTNNELRELIQYIDFKKL